MVHFVMSSEMCEHEAIVKINVGGSVVIRRLEFDKPVKGLRNIVIPFMCSDSCTYMGISEDSEVICEAIVYGRQGEFGHSILNVCKDLNIIRVTEEFN